MFLLHKLRVYPGCTGIKNLKDSEYSFVSEGIFKLPSDFYGRNIMVSAIVGKNGSGKSSILDIIYRVLNNVCALLCANLNTETHTVFGYILGVRAEIEFSTDNIENGKIGCYDNTLWLDMFYRNGTEKHICLGETTEKCIECNRITSLDDKSRTLILNELFYCSVVNYAPFTLNAHDYDSETCVVPNKDLIPDKLDLSHMNWVQAIFHKNDGYMSTITLTPYRNYGSFNSDKEARLAKERILNILTIHPDFIEGYKFKEARFKFNIERFKDKFGLTCATRENAFKPKMEIQEFVQEFEAILIEYLNSGKDSVAARVLRALGYKREDILLEDRYIYAYLYLVYKVLNCARYPAFEEFADICNTDFAISTNASKHLLNRVTNLTKAVLTEHSHITFKIERVKQYISIAHKLSEEQWTKGFSLEEYSSMIEDNDSSDSIIPAVKKLPPSFFENEIFLDKNESSESSIKFEGLSSGERLFYVTISSIIYHAMNLISIPDTKYRVKYRNMLIVLDESELCFHPEYQRTFINRLTGVIKRLKFNENLNFHILMTTHSPFILSDIPNTNILYLDNGTSVNPKDQKFINPFSANINDILSQSFFLMKDGFIGETARRVVLSLYKYLSDEPVNIQVEPLHWTKENARFVIDSIGEPLIRTSLRNLYNKKYRDGEAIRRQIEQLERELSQIENN